MADIALGSVEKIVQVGLAIKEAVEMVQQNREDCCKIDKQVLRVTGILKRLEETKMMDDPAMSVALEDLEETLRDALTLITTCQERHIVCLFCKAGDLSKQLRQVQDDIMQKMMLGVFAINVHATIILTNIEGAAAPLHPQDAGQVEVSHNDQSTIGCRIETDAKENNVPAGSDTPFDSLLVPELTKFSFTEVKNATNDFSEENLIGSGGFATVYKGVLQDRQVIAIKMFRQEGISDREIEKEILLLSKHEHKNIVKCLGYVHELEMIPCEYKGRIVLAESRRFCLVQEYLPNGDLEKINCGTARADWLSRLQLIQGIAHGIHYLHMQNIVHKDLKPSNILLDSDMNPKITDFGISTMFDDQTRSIITITLVGTMGYIAPEYIMSGVVSFTVDVYAFGIILLGTIIRGMCKAEQGPSVAASAQWASEVLREWDTRQMKELFDPSLLDESQLKGIKRCMEIGLRCADMEPNKRPKMREVVEMLDSIKQNAGTLKNPSSMVRRLNSLTSKGRRH